MINRHGIARHSDAGHVSVIARRDRDLLEISVVDDGIGMDDVAEATRGHGIENTRERLRSLYGDRASLTLARRSPRGTAATLRVPYRALGPEADRDS